MGCEENYQTVLKNLTGSNIVISYIRQILRYIRNWFMGSVLLIFTIFFFFQVLPSAIYITSWRMFSLSSTADSNCWRHLVFCKYVYIVIKTNLCVIPSHSRIFSYDKCYKMLYNVENVKFSYEDHSGYIPVKYRKIWNFYIKTMWLYSLWRWLLISEWSS